MKVQTSSLVFIVSAVGAAAFSPAVPRTTTFGVTSSSSALYEIREASDKAEVLRFGWDGTTALGGAVEVAKPARMLDEIRASGELIPEECELFNANVEMSSDDLTFEQVMEVIDQHYESQLLEFKNGDMLNKQGENEGTAKILSYAALSNMSKETTLKLWGQYYREVLANPNGTDHQNIRNFMKYGWEGVPFENGIALTRKNTGENEWDWDAESWIP